MRDKELSEWTCQGQKSGFFVATLEGKVVGTVAYKIKVHIQNSLLHLLHCFSGKGNGDLSTFYGQEAQKFRDCFKVDEQNRQMCF